MLKIVRKIKIIYISFLMDIDIDIDLDQLDHDDVAFEGSEGVSYQLIQKSIM